MRADVPFGLPAPDEIGEMVHALVGKGVKAKAAGDDVDAAIIAVYDESATGRPLFAVISDLPFAAYPAAALGLVPPGGARDSVKEGELTETLEDNAYEVFNVLSRLFNGAGRPHVKLRDTFAAGDCPADAWRMVSSPEIQYCVEIEVDGYGSGVARVVTLSLANQSA